MSDYERTHLCGNLYAAGNTDASGVCCPHLVYVTDKDSVSPKGKKLRQFDVYCMAEGRCRSMGCAASWTGCSPTWCPRRREQEAAE